MTLRRIVFSALIPVMLILGSVRASAQEIVLYASQAPVKAGNWLSFADSTAAGGARLSSQDWGVAKIATPAANPSSYAELNFTASAGRPYRLWIRGKTLNNSPYNDSVFVQFSGSVNSSGGAVYRIGTTSATEVNLEDCMGCMLSGWGWQDNGWGVGVLGPQIFFSSTGTQTIRIQVREDGISIDQIVLSPSTYLFGSPGVLKNDNVILAPSDGAAPTPTPTPTTLTESPNNTRLPPATQIVDSNLAVWTLSNGSILRNGAGTSGAGSQILYCNRTVYALGTDSAWWRWSNGWSRVGFLDPCGSSSPTPTPTPVPNQAPQVSISAAPTSGNIPLFVSFSASGSDVDGFITSYQWNFGNGVTAVGQTPTYTYTSAGTYTARVTVTDDDGATASATVAINVSSPPPPSSGGSLRVLSWNVAFGLGTDNVRDYNRTATYIANMNADLAGLCEMPSEYIGTLVNSLNQKTGRSWFWHFVPKYDGTTEGNLILSKYSFSSTGGRFLSAQRSVAQVTVNVGGRTINFFATHLDADSSGTRYTQAGELLAYSTGFSESRIIVGDFNAGPDLSESVRMTSAYYDTWMRAMNAGTATAYPDNPIWMHTRTRRGRIDYVYYTNTSSALILQGTQIPDTRNLSQTNVSITLGTLDDRGVRPSDHNPMIANFSIQ